jgi:hypothetical protein
MDVDRKWQRYRNVLMLILLYVQVFTLVYFNRRHTVGLHNVSLRLFYYTGLTLAITNLKVEIDQITETSCILNIRLTVDSVQHNCCVMNQLL